MRILPGKHTGRPAILSAVFLMLTTCLLICPLSEGKERGGAEPAALEGILTSQNNRQWRYAFDISRQETSVVVHVAVNLIPVHGATYRDVKEKKKEWEEAIEDIWSSKFALQSKDGEMYPIVVDVNFNGPDFHHEVLVSKGRGRIDQLHWNLDDSPRIVAHEFGHMIGCFDEYPDGDAAKDKFEGAPESSIMFDPFGAGNVYPHHFHMIKSWSELYMDSATNEIRLITLERL